MLRQYRWNTILLFMAAAWLPVTASPQTTQTPNAELVKAASAGDLAGMQRALAAGADPNARDAGKSTALILASIAGQEKAVRLLLDKHADVNARDADYATALHCAVEKSHTDVAQLLIERGADVTAVDGHGASLVPLAVQTHDVALVRMLLDKGAAIEAGNDQAEPPLYLAVGNGDIPMVKLLLSRHANPNHGDSWVGSPLSQVVGGHDLELVELLLDNGADPDRSMSEQGTTNLMVAVQFGSVSIIEAMLARSTDVDQADRFGETPLMVAAEQGKPDAVRLLLAHHADPSKTDQAGQTALKFALKGKTPGHLEAARLLRQAPHPTPHSTATAGPIKSDIKVYLDGKELPTLSPFDDGSTAPLIVDGILLIPIRFVKEHLVKNLLLDRDWGIIQLQFGLMLKIGSSEWHGRADFGTDGLAIAGYKLPVAPHKIRGRIYIPVDRELFKALRLPFEWDAGKHELRFTHRQ